MNDIGRILNAIMICLAIAVWASLILWVVIKLFKKDYLNFKRAILYLFNSSIFYIGIPFYVRLALVVQGPKEATKEASIQVLKNDCLSEATWYIGVSLVVSLTLLILNYLFQRYILKKVEKKTLLILTIIDFSLLVVLSALAIFNYYLSISHEIDSYHN